MAWNIAIPAAISLLGMFMSGKGGSSGAGNIQQQMTPEMREMLQMQLARMRGQEPLYNDVMGMARSLLPTRYRGAGAPSGLSGVARPRPDANPGVRGPGSHAPGGSNYDPTQHNGGRVPFRN